MIIGSHPHVIQPVELIHSEDGESTTVCLYSTGNYVSNQRQELMDSCHSVVYLTAFQLFELLSQAAFGRDRQGQSGRQAYPYIFDCDLLSIDDLGTELPNSFTVSQLFLCVNERILRKKSTLISSNLDMEALRNIYSERTLSRIISCYTIRQLPGSDIRIRKKLNAGSPGEI